MPLLRLIISHRRAGSYPFADFGHVYTTMLSSLTDLPTDLIARVAELLPNQPKSKKGWIDLANRSLWIY